MVKFERIFFCVLVFYLLVILYLEFTRNCITYDSIVTHELSPIFNQKSRVVPFTQNTTECADVKLNVTGQNGLLQEEIFVSAHSVNHNALENEGKFKFGTKIIYNRIPKCGSTTLRYLVKKLSIWNYFHHESSQLYERRVFNFSETGNDEEEEFVRRLQSKPDPWFYDRHIHFVNFTKYGYDMPIYINLVRDPVDRFVSRYYHIRYISPRNMTRERFVRSVNDCIDNNIPECSIFNVKYDTFLLIPFFCGQEEFCMHPTERALTRAKYNVIKYYVVVGITEKFEAFIHVLEYLLPQFFEGIVSFYEQNKKTRNQGVRKDILTGRNRRKLQDMMKIEYEFYNFIKARFYDIFHKIHLTRRLLNDY